MANIQVNISITGARGAGKTAVKNIIIKALKAEGLNAYGLKEVKTTESLIVDGELQFT